MHRRPPPAAPDPGRPRVTLVTARWGDTGDERQFATRAIAGALATRARVNVVHLVGDTLQAGTLWDGAFEVRRLRSTVASPLGEAILLAALEATDPYKVVPALAGRDLQALEGGGSDQVVEAIAESDPDVVVVGGLQQAWPPAWPMMLERRPRTVVWPLSGDDPLIGLPGYRDLLEQADAICTIGEGEHRRVLGLGTLRRQPSVVKVPPALSVNRAAAAHSLPGLTGRDGYVLVLRGFPAGTVERRPPPDYRLVRERFPDLVIAEVSNSGWRVFGDGLDELIPFAPSRVNLWRLMSHALVTVDLRPDSVFGREVIESMLIGTPVAVPAASWAREPVERSGGGLVFAEDSHLPAVIESLGDPQRRSELADRGRRWCEEHHGDQERFAAEVVEAVLAPAGATPAGPA